MTALRAYARDRALPAALGDAGLVLPEDDALAALVAARLAGPGVTLEGVELLHARWKPGVALVGLYRVQVAGHGERLVGYKRHVGGKGARLASDFVPEERAVTAATPLLATAPLDGGDGHLWTFPADRDLRGAQRAFDLDRFARRFDEAGVCPGFVLRKRASHLEVLRYKPERRVVARLDAKLRGEGGADTRAARRFGLRVLPLGEAAGVAARRRQLEAALARQHGAAEARVATAASTLVPRLAHFDERDGLLVEDWLDGATHTSTEFRHAAEAGAALAALHAAPLSPDVAGERSAAASGPAGLDVLARLTGLEAATRRLGAALAAHGHGRRTVFVHGDFHPDQVLTTGEGPRLLDLDTLGLGAPEVDLASWIADHLTEAPSVTYTDAAATLVREYTRRGGAFDADRLGLEVGAALLARAAAAVRRLEVGAARKAAALVARAEAVLAGEDAP